MAKFYAVKIGRKPGIYLTWDECKQQVDKFKGAVYKSFNSKDEAKVFLEEKKIKFDSGLIAYVDGSYNIKTKEKLYDMEYSVINLIDSQTLEAIKKEENKKEKEQNEN